MASLLYEQINSSLLSKVTDYDFLCMPEEDVESTLLEYMKTALSKPYCRRLFSSIAYDNENKQLTYELKIPSQDPSEDDDFVIELLAQGMLVEWTKPMVNSRLLEKQMITSSKESKFYSQASHLATVNDVYKDARTEQKTLIRDRGFIYNSYLGGNNGQA